MTTSCESDDSERMNFYKHMQNRRRRKLPHVHKRQLAHFHSFWPTFRGALAWMRKNQETLNTAIGLLDIYPGLIQDSCMDTFWEFLKPYLEANDTRKSKKISLGVNPVLNHNRDREQTTAVKPCHTIPSISVTYDDEYDDDILRDSDFNKRKTKIYVSGHATTAFLSSPFEKLVSELNDEYTVLKTVPPSVSAPKLNETLSESDMLVFLMSRESVTNPSSYRDISAAWAMDMPVLFIKPPGFKLPTPLPDSVVLYTFEDQNKFVSRKSSTGKLLPHSVSPSLGRGLRATGTLPKLRTTSAHEIHPHKPLVHRDSCDLILILINGYRDALVWNPIRQKESFEDIKMAVEQMIVRMFSGTPSPASDTLSDGGQSRNGQKSRSHGLLQVPDLDIPHPVSETSSSDVITNPTIEEDIYSSNNLLGDWDRVTTPTEKETFYVVFKDRHSPGNVVKWPPVAPEIEADDIYADSPISFKDVDLTLEMRIDTSDNDSCTDVF